MTSKYELRLPEIIATSDNLNALERLAKSADMDTEGGAIGYVITDMTTGEIMAMQKPGLDTTIKDLQDKEVLSIRLYNYMLRELCKITGKDIDEIIANTTMRDIREMVLGGKFVGVPGMGAKTIEEFYEILIKFCGDTRITRLAINENIDLNMQYLKLWKQDASFRNAMERVNKEYFADLTEEYFQKHGF